MNTKPTGAGAYKTQKKVKGQKLYRRKREVETVDGKSPRYADFLATADRKTQQMFFGGGNAGSIRADQFRKALKTKTPQQALIDLTNKVPKTKRERRFKPVDS